MPVSTYQFRSVRNGLKGEVGKTNAVRGSLEAREGKRELCEGVRLLNFLAGSPRRQPRALLVSIPDSWNGAMGGVWKEAGSGRGIREAMPAARRLLRAEGRKGALHDGT